MPVYDIECKKCGHVKEVLIKISESLPVCEKCSGETKKLLSTPAFVVDSAVSQIKYLKGK